MSGLLSAQGLGVKFGGLHAVSNLNFEVQEGKILSLIGPNGAGKSTVFNCLTGFVPLSSGTVLFKGQPFKGFSPDKIVQKGIARTFQSIRLFKTLTVEENVMSGLHIRTKSNVLSTLFNPRKSKKEEEWVREEVKRLLSFVGLEDKEMIRASDLSYGEQRKLEIARALATNPAILLLDEPAAGMNHSEKNELKELIYSIRDSGTTVVIIEHDMQLIMDISDWIIVLHYGEMLVEGLPEDIKKDPRVIESYLGEEG
ncbi:ABC transporter ATP-binding protein [Neobacillus niacini]|uniref:ABC transporter ATP-binding protein n=1 Tax=Neobacillus niacini TaxID=86668 RepID=UPI002861BCDC|nr:ABC transporter ATP-binding protein [Neobacillus niacini]MDR6998497.1 ABC-type branched-subunit amino acid transport system ATPase component [Neobacillus niacini]